MSAAAIKNVDQARLLNAVRLPLWRLLAASAETGFRALFCRRLFKTGTQALV